MKLLDYYKMKLKIDDMPDFLKKYLELPYMKRLKDVTYLCGMDYASKKIYDFKEHISRYDHSLTTALMTWNLTNDKEATIAALHHDVSTPCFSHVIDYMNQDYLVQESTEKHIEDILKNDSQLAIYSSEDKINIGDIINFKQYTVVDLERPKLCADRIDGIILTGIAWTKKVNKDEIDEIIDSIEVYKNEDNQDEIGFNNEDAAINALLINNDIDILCHTRFDTYMMELLANITGLAIKRGYIDYESLYLLTEEQVLYIFENIEDPDIKVMLNDFYNMEKSKIPTGYEMPKVKRRTINPIVCGERMG